MWLPVLLLITASSALPSARPQLPENSPPPPRVPGVLELMLVNQPNGVDGSCSNFLASQFGGAT